MWQIVELSIIQLQGPLFLDIAVFILYKPVLTQYTVMHIFLLVYKWHSAGQTFQNLWQPNLKKGQKSYPVSIAR